MRLEKLVNWFHEMKARARSQGSGVILEPLDPDEVASWGERLTECHTALKLADELRKMLPAEG